MIAPSFTEILVIGLIALVIFGGAKLPQVGDGLGRAIKNFKRGLGGQQTDDRPASGQPTPPEPNRDGKPQA